MLDKEATFPHAYFDNKKTQKPPVMIPSNSSTFKESRLHAVQSWLIGKEMPYAKTTVAFLYEYALEFPKGELKEDWNSNKVLIRAPKAKISPMDLLTRGDSSALTTRTASSGTVDWKEPFYKICMAYRIKKARESPDSNYVSGLVTKLSNLGKSCV